MARKESWRGAIIVVFKEGVTQLRKREIVRRLGCKFQEGFDGSGRTNVIVVKPGDDEKLVKQFKTYSEVEAASINNDGVDL